jgi:hypothetical protein
MVSRLRLSKHDRARAVIALRRHLADESSIVKTFALQALTELANADAALVPAVKGLLNAAAESGTPAMRARSRKLLRQFLPL